jgi:hypothetical protein
LAIAVATVLAALCALHVHWGIGGVGGPSVALPEVDGRPLFIPSRFACFAVAAALAGASYLLLSRGGVVSSPFPAPWIQAGTLGVGAVFVLRAIGDFRVCGFFKRVHGTPFAVWDTRLFSPLSLAIGLASLWVAIAS